MTEDPLATIVVTARERYSTALRCLPRLISTTPGPHRLVYVAGGAPPYIRDFLTAQCAARGYDLLLEPGFLSPNEARNLGLQRVTTKYAVFLDNDVVVEPGWLDALVRCAEETGADVVGPLVLFGEPEQGYIHSVGGDLEFFDEGDRHWMVETHRYPNVCLKTNPVELRRARCDYVEFHCMLTRRDLFDRTGPLDPDILSSCEHMDLLLRVREHGGAIYTEPAAVVSYLTDADYVMSDAAFFARRWCDEWNDHTFAHFARKWRLERESSFFRDHESFIWRQQEICRLPRAGVAPQAPVRIGAHPFAQTVLQLSSQMAALGYRPRQIETMEQGYQAAARVYDGVYRESGKTLAGHGVGTASALAAYGAPVTVIVAAMNHAAYSLGRYPAHAEHDLAAQRRWLTARIGWRAEAQVFEYFSLDFQELEAAVLAADPDQLPVRLAYAVMMRVANSIDEHIDGGLLRFADPADAMARNSAQNERWDTIYRRAGAALGIEAMVDILTALHEELKSLAPLPGAGLGWPGFITFDPETREPVRRIARRPAAGAPVAAPEPLDAAHATAPVEAAPLLERLRQQHLGPTLVEFDLAAVQSLNGGQLSLSDGSLQLITDPAQWAYSCSLPLTPGAAGAALAPRTVRVALEVETGALGVGILRKGSTTEFLVLEQSKTSGDVSDLLFFVPDLREAGHLVFRSWTAGGSTAAITAIALHEGIPGPR
ncbi:MAG: glycosyltransferase family 2 protein [Chloroflexi bacterium]|nr:glycosyltransferase family 2 protein [Chloroflexota bacterium]